MTGTSKSVADLDADQSGDESEETSGAYDRSSESEMDFDATVDGQGREKAASSRSEVCPYAGGLWSSTGMLFSWHTIMR